MILYKVRERIAFLLLNKFFNYLSCIKVNAIWWLFDIKDLSSKILKDIYIWIQNKYVEFTRKLHKSKVKKKIFLKLVNMEEDKKREEDFWVKKLGLKSEVLFFYNFFIFFRFYIFFKFFDIVYFDL